MPPTAHEVAARALEAANKAQHAAEIAQMTANNVITEMRQRFDRQDDESKEFRTSLMREIQAGNRAFDAFKSDFDQMDNRCKGHEDTIYGNKEKNLVGVVSQVQEHDSDIRKGKWTIWLCGIMVSWAVIYITYFYGDALKRGIFNPSDSEWHWRVTREVKKVVKPEALQPEKESTGN